MEFPGVGGVVFLLVVGHLIGLGLLWFIDRVTAARDFFARVREDRKKLAKAEDLLVAADAEVASLRGLLSGAIESGRVEVREALGKELEAARSENRALLATLEDRSEAVRRLQKEVLEQRAGVVKFAVGDQVRTKTHPCGTGRVTAVERAVLSVRLDSGYEGCWGTYGVELVERPAVKCEYVVADHSGSRACGKPATPIFFSGKPRCEDHARGFFG